MSVQAFDIKAPKVAKTKMFRDHRVMFIDILECDSSGELAKAIGRLMETYTIIDLQYSVVPVTFLGVTYAKKWTALVLVGEER